jgi:hypothetical protein
VRHLARPHRLADPIDDKAIGAVGLQQQIAGDREASANGKESLGAGAAATKLDDAKGCAIAGEVADVVLALEAGGRLAQQPHLPVVGRAVLR